MIINVLVYYVYNIRRMNIFVYIEIMVPKT